MIETYYVGAYWGPRRESEEQCARRACSFFRALAKCDPLFTRWFRPPRSRKHASTPLSVEVAALEELFIQGKVRNDTGGIIEDLGSRIFADSAPWPDTSPHEISSVNIRCGAHATPGPNSCVMKLPSSGDPMEQLVQSPVLANILRAMVLAWEPERCIATSHAHRELVSERGIVGTFVGWLMYFPNQLGPVPSLPPPVQVERLEDKGSLVILTPERFTASNPEHVALASHVREAFSQAGLLRSIT